LRAPEDRGWCIQALSSTYGAMAMTPSRSRARESSRGAVKLNQTQ
jgi:hypothetical protein